MKRLRTLVAQRKSLFGLGAIFICLLVLSIWSHGTAENTAGATPAGSASPEPMPSLGGAVVKVVSSVALVIAVLYGGVYLTRLVSRRTGAGSLKPDTISVLHKRHIAPKKAIYVLAIGSRAMVVGVTDTQISHLADLTADEVASIKVPETNRAKQFKKHLLSFGLGIDEKTKGM